MYDPRKELVCVFPFLGKMLLEIQNACKVQLKELYGVAN